MNATLLPGEAQPGARAHLAKFVLAITMPKLERAVQRLTANTPFSDRFLWTASADAFWGPRRVLAVLFRHEQRRQEKGYRPW